MSGPFDAIEAIEALNRAKGLARIPKEVASDAEALEAAAEAAEKNRGFIDKGRVRGEHSGLTSEETAKHLESIKNPVAVPPNASDLKLDIKGIVASTRSKNLGRIKASRIWYSEAQQYAEKLVKASKVDPSKYEAEIAAETEKRHKDIVDENHRSSKFPLLAKIQTQIIRRSFWIPGWRDGLGWFGSPPAQNLVAKKIGEPFAMLFGETAGPWIYRGSATFLNSWFSAVRLAAWPVTKILRPLLGNAGSAIAMVSIGGLFTFGIEHFKSGGTGTYSDPLDTIKKSLEQRKNKWGSNRFYMDLHSGDPVREARAKKLLEAGYQGFANNAAYQDLSNNIVTTYGKDSKVAKIYGQLYAVDPLSQIDPNAVRSTAIDWSETATVEAPRIWLYLAKGGKWVLAGGKEPAKTILLDNGSDPNALPYKLGDIAALATYKAQNDITREFYIPPDAVKNIDSVNAIALKKEEAASAGPEGYKDLLNKIDGKRLNNPEKSVEKSGTVHVLYLDEADQKDITYRAAFSNVLFNVLHESEGANVTNSNIVMSANTLPGKDDPHPAKFHFVQKENSAEYVTLTGQFEGKPCQFLLIQTVPESPSDKSKFALVPMSEVWDNPNVAGLNNSHKEGPANFKMSDSATQAGGWWIAIPLVLGYMGINIGASRLRKAPASAAQAGKEAKTFDMIQDGKGGWVVDQTTRTEQAVSRDLNVAETATREVGEVAREVSSASRFLGSISRHLPFAGTTLATFFGASMGLSAAETAKLAADATPGVRIASAPNSAERSVRALGDSGYALEGVGAIITAPLEEAIRYGADVFKEATGKDTGIQGTMLTDVAQSSSLSVVPEIRALGLARQAEVVAVKWGYDLYQRMEKWNEARQLDNAVRSRAAMNARLAASGATISSPQHSSSPSQQAQDQSLSCFRHAPPPRGALASARLT